MATNSQNDATLYFTTSAVNGFTVHNANFLHKTIVKHLRKKCREMGIHTDDWYIEGLGGTAALNTILMALTSFYHSHEGWFILFKLLGILASLKKTVSFLFELPWRLSNLWHRLTHLQNDSGDVLPRLFIWVRAEINREACASTSIKTMPRSVRQAAHELIQLIPIFESEIQKLAPGIPVEFQLTAKYGPAHGSYPAIDIVHYMNKEPYTRRVNDCLVRISEKHLSYRLVFHRLKLTNWLRVETLKDVSII